MLQLLVFLKDVFHIGECLAPLVGVMEPLNLLVSALKFLEEMGILLLELCFGMSKLLSLGLEFVGSFVGSSKL